MKFSLLSVLFLALPFITVAQVDEPSLNLYFGYDLDELTDEHRAQLKEFVSSLECDSIFLSVSGHTDNHASDEYNIALSQRRVNSALIGLEELGIGAAQIQTERKGEFVPVATNDLDEGRAKNRRVEIRVLNCPIDTTTNDLLRLLALEPQIRRVDVGRDTVLVLDGGTILHLSANTFTLPAGFADSTRIRLELTEVLTIGDMIRANVVTKTSSGELLQTGGMLKIEAFADSVKLDSEEPMIAEFPGQFEGDYRAFTGSHDGHSRATQWRNAPMQLGDALLNGCNTISRGRVRTRVLPCNFWCSLRRTLNGLSWKPEPDYSISGRDWRLSPDSMLYDVCFLDSYISYDSLVTLCKVYNVKDTRFLLDSVFKDEYSEAGFDNYLDYAKDQAVKEFEAVQNRIRNGQATATEFYTAIPVFSGWNNLDVFMKIPSRQQTEVIAQSPRRMNQELIRFIAPDYRICVGPSTVRGREIRFSPVKVGIDGEVVGIKYNKGKIYFARASMQNIDDTEVELSYREVTYDELEHELAQLGGAFQYAVRY